MFIAPNYRISAVQRFRELNAGRPSRRSALRRLATVRSDPRLAPWTRVDTQSRYLSHNGCAPRSNAIREPFNAVICHPTGRGSRATYCGDHTTRVAAVFKHRMIIQRVVTAAQRAVAVAQRAVASDSRVWKPSDARVANAAVAVMSKKRRVAVAASAVAVAQRTQTPTLRVWQNLRNAWRRDDQLWQRAAAAPTCRRRWNRTTCDSTGALLTPATPGCPGDSNKPTSNQRRWVHKGG
jgi:hypothetical protein